MVYSPLPHPLNFLLICWWGLKLIWKSTHVVQALQIGNSHSLASLRMWWDLFIHTARCNLQSRAQTMPLTTIILWPKIFEVEVKIFSHDISSSLQMQSVVGSLTMKAEFCKTAKYLPHENLIYVVYMYYSECLVIHNSASPHSHCPHCSPTLQATWALCTV